MSKKKKKKKHTSKVEVKEVKKEPKEKSRIMEMLYPVFSVLFMEIVLKVSVGGSIRENLLYISLFSVSYGVLICLLANVTKSQKWNRRMQFILLMIISVWFNVNYFIYHTFKIFYDLNTVFAGGEDAATGFADQIIDMVFSADGLFHIALFLFPCMFFFFAKRYFEMGKRLKRGSVLAGTGVMIGSFILSLLMIDTFHNWNMLGSEYSYQTSVSQFGLLSSFGLDLCYHAGNQEASFEAVIEETVEEEPVKEVKVYQKQVLDIDFETLAKEDTGTYQQLDEYILSLKPTKENDYTGLFAGKNLIFISAEAFSGYIIDPDVTPTLYRLANRGIQFTDYYQPASSGTTGGEYENLFGMLPMSGGSSFKMTSDRNNYITIGNALDRQGYNGWAFHPNDYTYYSRDLTHNNLGYSNGFMGYGNGLEKVITKQWPQSDLEMVQGTIDMYIDHAPFNVYYMSVSGHNPYSKGGNKISAKNYDRVKDLDYSEEVKCYIAANLELEDALTYLIERLEEKGIAEDTVIVIGADHFPYGLDYNESLANSSSLMELYGAPITNYLQRDQNRLIMWCESLEAEEPIVVDTPTFSLDILPTLCNLFDVDWDSRLLPGRDVFSDATPLVFDTGYDWKTDKGTYLSGTGVFTPNEGVTVSDQYVERMRNIVKNKINYCSSVLKSDYFTHLFGPKTDPQTAPIPYEFVEDDTEE